MTPLEPQATRTAAADHARAAGRLSPSWNDLREQRVLQRVQAASTERSTPRRRSWVGWALAAAALLAVVGWAVVRGRSSPGTSAQTAPSSAAPAPREGGAEVALDDGSVVRLVADARVTVHEQSATAVRLTQTKGLARYEVAHLPARAFVVAVADAEVEVHGTVFTVELLPKTVRVHVVEGQVTVRGDGRSVKLTTGETLEVAAFRAPMPSASTTAPVVPSAESKPTPSASVQKPKSSVDALLSGADAARAEGRLDEAAELLRTLVAQHPGDPRVPSALFTLGRVERARGRHAAAAAAFAKVTGALAEDALAEEATSWKTAGDVARARAAAKRYLTSHPKGLHAQRMLALAE